MQGACAGGMCRGACAGGMFRGHVQGACAWGHVILYEYMHYLTFFRHERAHAWMIKAASLNLSSRAVD